jgi:hypothetical protein
MCAFVQGVIVYKYIIYKYITYSVTANPGDGQARRKHAGAIN